MLCGYRSPTGQQLKNAPAQTRKMHEQFGSGEWKALEAQSATNRTLHRRDLFDQDSKRGERLTVDAAGG
jgi:sialic acid synthase SpsE